jgi:hypothetical protein
MTLACLERGENGESHGLRQRIFDQNEIKTGVCGLRHALLEVPAGLNPIPAVPQVCGQGFTKFHVWINNLHTRCGESIHVVHVMLEVIWCERLAHI